MESNQRVCRSEKTLERREQTSNFQDNVFTIPSSNLSFRCKDRLNLDPAIHNNDDDD